MKKFWKISIFVCVGLVFFNNSTVAAKVAPAEDMVTTTIASAAEKKAYQDKLESLKAFVKSGIEYIHNNGAQKAYQEFSNPKGKFRKGDLYLFVYNYQGTNLAHGADPKHMVGKSFFELHDVYGTKVFMLIAKVAKLGGGFVHYFWPKPDSNDIEYKTAYIAPIDKNTFIGSGLYENIETPVMGLEVRIEELKAFVREAIEYYKAKGEKVAFAEFNKLDGKFNRGSMYIFVGNDAGVLLANGVDDGSVIGKSYIDSRDEFGTPFIQMFIEAAKSGGGIVSYYWPNPENKKIELKTAYVAPLTDHLYIASGFYGT